MVVKRQCSFCANEIEPGTGTMFVKRDGTVFHFCSSSCRKQQLHLGRVGHRRKWTRAHAMKRVLGHVGAPPTEKTALPAAPEAPAPSAGAEGAPPKPEAKPAEGASTAASQKAPPTEAPAAESKEGSAAPALSKPRRRTPKAAKGSAGEAAPSSPPPS